jgi:hypothetical protein
MVLVGLRRLLSPGDGGNRPLPQPVGQRDAAPPGHAPKSGPGSRPVYRAFERLAPLSPP